MDEVDKEQWEAPYRKVAAVHELQESNYLVNLYLNCYERHYKAKFIFPLGNAHLTLIQDIKKQAQDRTAALIEHYFKVKEQWFSQQNHSLECLKKNLNKVNADYEKRSQMTQTSETFIKSWLSCDKCFKHFWWVGNPHKLEGPRICEECE